jgi:hypothetical protein
MSSYQQDQARDDHGRFASVGAGASQAKSERVALNQKLDARNRSLTYGFGPAARAVENKPAPAAHTVSIESAVNGKSLDAKNAANHSNFTLAQMSALGATKAKVGGP